MEYFDLRSFNEAHLLVRAEEVFGFGAYVESWISNNNYIKLFAYSNFYVEITYDHSSYSISEIKAISIDKAIDKYVSLNEFSSEIQSITFS